MSELRELCIGDLLDYIEEHGKTNDPIEVITLNGVNESGKLCWTAVIAVGDRAQLVNRLGSDLDALAYAVTVAPATSGDVQ